MKVFLDTVGCRLNQSEIETFSRQFRAAGHEIVEKPALADLVVVNTCSVTHEAASDSRQKIRQAHKAGAGAVVATGCWVTLEPEAAASLPGVSRVVSNPDKHNLVSQVLSQPAELFDQEPLSRTPLPGARLRTRAFIKTQDGCNNRCTFCITTIARGPAASRAQVEILQDIESALQGGVQEIVLTGVHLGSWGTDLPGQNRLIHLVRAILRESQVPRIRLSSLEPWDLDEEFFGLWEDSRMCRHLHLPLQSGSAKTLRHMARNTTPEKFTALVESARRAIPDVALTTDLIAGFPGETEADFLESLEFVRQMNFSGGHVFHYSERPGTAAARFPNPVHPLVRKERSSRLREILARSGEAYREKYVGRVMPVLWEFTGGVGPEGWDLSGLTGNYLRVASRDAVDHWNQITPVQLTGLNVDGLDGRIVSAGN